MEMRGNAARINLTLNAGSYHCLYGSWQESDDAEATIPSATWLTLEANRSLYSLPKLQDYADDSYQLGLFGSADVWMVECYEPSDFTWKDMNIAIPAVAWNGDGSEQQQQPILRLVTVEPNGKISNSRALPLTAKRIPWSVSFDLPPSVRVGEELIVDVTITNHMINCSQVRNTCRPFGFTPSWQCCQTLLRCHGESGIGSLSREMARYIPIALSVQSNRFDMFKSICCQKLARCAGRARFKRPFDSFICKAAPVNRAPRFGDRNIYPVFLGVFHPGFRLVESETVD